MTKLPERFVGDPADPEYCQTCDKARKVCRDCGNCREHCTCPDPCEVCGYYKAGEIANQVMFCNCQVCPVCGKKTLDDLWDYEYNCCEKCAAKKPHLGYRHNTEGDPK